jgi:hypothetical protein
MNAPPTTPYSSDLDHREALPTLRANASRIRELTRVWTAKQFDATYAPGKWSARQILTHLAQTELAFGTRARMALCTKDYVAQPFEQDAWMAKETRLTGPEALEAFLALARMNAVFFEGLSAADRATPLSHPEFGTLTVDWIIHQVAGHQVHHLHQLEQIARG